jgi:hypothetical protein
MTRDAASRARNELPRARCYIGCYTVATRGGSPVAIGRCFEIEIGSGTGIRTLNLAVNSRLLYR